MKTKIKNKFSKIIAVVLVAVLSAVGIPFGTGTADAAENYNTYETKFITEYGVTGMFGDSAFIVANVGGYGLVDISGNELISCKYKEMQPLQYSDNLLVQNSENTWLVVNRTGETVYSLGNYNSMSELSQTIFAGITDGEEDTTITIMKNDGTIIFADGEVVSFSTSYNGTLATVCEADDTWDCISKDGTVTELGKFDSVYEIQEGMFQASNYGETTEETRTTIINSNGTVVVPEYKVVHTIPGAGFIVYDGKNYKGLNEDGTVYETYSLLLGSYYSIAPLNPGSSIVALTVEKGGNGNVGVVTQISKYYKNTYSGEIARSYMFNIKSDDYPSIYLSDDEKYLSVLADGEWSIYDNEGIKQNISLDESYDDVRVTENGKVIASLVDEDFNIITTVFNMDGTKVLDSVYDYIFTDNGNIVAADANNNYSLYNASGAKIKDLDGVEGVYTKEGINAIYVFDSNYNQGIMSLDGEWIVNFENAEDVNVYDNGYFSMSTNKKYAVCKLKYDENPPEETTTPQTTTAAETTTPQVTDSETTTVTETTPQVTTQQETTTQITETTPQVTTTSNKDVTTSITPPAKAKLAKVKAGKKKASLTIKKVKGAKGYMVQYSSNKKFKKAKKVYTKKLKLVVKKLKTNKKYYFRIKAYKLNGKEKVLSNKWSNVIKTTIK